MSGCLDHLIENVRDPNCPLGKAGLCHRVPNWVLPDGRQYAVVVNNPREGLDAGGVVDLGAIEIIVRGGSDLIGWFTTRLSIAGARQLMG